MLAGSVWGWYLAEVARASLNRNPGAIQDRAKQNIVADRSRTGMDVHRRIDTRPLTENLYLALEGLSQLPGGRPAFLTPRASVR